MEEKKIAVLTDTDCDLAPEYFKKYPIFRLPLVVTSGEKTYRDGIDITVEEVYARQKTENFKTSLPRIEDIDATLNAIRDAGYTQVIVLLIGGALSGATNLMRLTAESRTDLDIAVYDSKSASIGVGLLAVQVAQCAARGVPFHLVKKLTEQLVDDTHVFFSIDTLEYLQRGGRVGRVTALAGSLLQIKPILTMENDGVINTAAKVRGRRAVAPRLIELAQGCLPAERVRYNLVVCDGGCPAEGDALEAALVKALPGAEQLLRGKIDATLAVHLGPNLLGAGIQILRSEVL